MPFSSITPTNDTTYYYKVYAYNEVPNYSSGTSSVTATPVDAAQFVDSEIELPGISYSSLAWGDYDNDGDLDLAVSGLTGSEYITRIYRNGGSNTFTNIEAGLTGVACGSLAWGDYDNECICQVIRGLTV